MHFVFQLLQKRLRIGMLSSGIYAAKVQTPIVFFLFLFRFSFPSLFFINRFYFLSIDFIFCQQIFCFPFSFLVFFIGTENVFFFIVFSIILMCFYGKHNFFLDFLSPSRFENFLFHRLFIPPSSFVSGVFIRLPALSFVFLHCHSYSYIVIRIRCDPHRLSFLFI